MRSSLLALTISAIALGGCTADVVMLSSEVSFDPSSAKALCGRNVDPVLLPGPIVGKRIVVVCEKDKIATNVVPGMVLNVSTANLGVRRFVSSLAKIEFCPVASPAPMRGCIEPRRPDFAGPFRLPVRHVPTGDILHPEERYFLAATLSIFRKNTDFGTQENDAMNTAIAAISQHEAQIWNALVDSLRLVMDARVEQSGKARDTAMFISLATFCSQLRKNQPDDSSFAPVVSLLSDSCSQEVASRNLVTGVEEGEDKGRKNVWAELFELFSPDDVGDRIGAGLNDTKVGLMLHARHVSVSASIGGMFIDRGGAEAGWTLQEWQASDVCSVTRTSEDGLTRQTIRRTIRAIRVRPTNVRFAVTEDPTAITHKVIEENTLGLTRRAIVTLQSRLIFTNPAISSHDLHLLKASDIADVEWSDSEDIAQPDPCRPQKHGP